MNKNSITVEINNVYERIKCQQFLPLKDRDNLVNQVDAFIENGAIVDGELIEMINGVIFKIVDDLTLLNKENDRNAFSDVVELLLNQSTKLAKTI